MRPSKKLLYVQPVLTGYRVQVIAALRSAYELRIAADPADPRLGHARVTAPELRLTSTFSLLGGRLFFQGRLLGQIVRFKPDVVLIFGNVRYLSLWCVLLLCKLLGIRCWVHGQGLYRFPQPSFLRRLVYRSVVGLSAGYICYTELSRETLFRVKCPAKKLHVAANSLSLDLVVPPEQKSFQEDGVLFVGRLRDGSELQVLLDAARELRSAGVQVVVHVVGDGPSRAALEGMHTGDHVRWYGALHDAEAVASVSKSCRVGCYPGSAGLSVVHFLGLSLPPIVDAHMPRHMGPEPSYVAHGVNGFTFDSSVESGLLAMLRQVWSLDQHQMRVVAQNAYQKYLELNTPSLGRRIVELLGAEV